MNTEIKVEGKKSSYTIRSVMSDSKRQMIDGTAVFAIIAQDDKTGEAVESKEYKIENFQNPHLMRLLEETAGRAKNDFE